VAGFGKRHRQRQADVSKPNDPDVQRVRSMSQV
jgi:hypothetical protein